MSESLTKRQLLDPHSSPSRYHSTDSTPQHSHQAMKSSPFPPRAAAAAESPLSSSVESPPPPPPARPLADVVPPKVVKEREERERQREWRTSRWNELHYHHKESLAVELERRIHLLVWITVELSLSLVLLVLHIGELGVAVASSMFFVTLIGYLITQLRAHVLTALYALYCMAHLHLGVLSEHAYVLLHLVSCVVLAVCEVVGWSLYRQEERSQEWARQEEELDELIVRTDMNEYMRLAHRAEHRDSSSCFA